MSRHGLKGIKTRTTADKEPNTYQSQPPMNEEYTQNQALAFSSSYVFVTANKYPEIVEHESNDYKSEHLVTSTDCKVPPEPSEPHKDTSEIDVHSLRSSVRGLTDTSLRVYLRTVRKTLFKTPTFYKDPDLSLCSSIRNNHIDQKRREVLLMIWDEALEKYPEVVLKSWKLV
jgi:hypothetical protein